MRFSAFETLTLPSIRSQSDPNFTFAILIGDSLPRHAKDRLYEVTANVPQIKIVERPSGPYRQVAQEVVNSVRNWEAPICAQFRLDDDDAVHDSNDGDDADAVIMTLLLMCCCCCCF